MPQKRKQRIAKFIKQMESQAKRLRADVRKRAKAAGVEKKLHQAAAQLEKRAKTVADQVRKHAAAIKKELAGTAKKPARKARTRKKRKK
jgi:hypothetical protein